MNFIHPDIIRGMEYKYGQRKLERNWEIYSRKVAEQELFTQAKPKLAPAVEKKSSPETKLSAIVPSLIGMGIGKALFGQLPIPITPEWMYYPAKGEEPPKAPIYEPVPTGALSEYAWGARTLRLIYPYMRGTDIYNLQFALFDLKFFYQKIDGIYGPATAGAVKNYQQARGLIADGIVGPQTWATLKTDWIAFTSGKEAAAATAVTKVTEGETAKTITETEKGEGEKPPVVPWWLIGLGAVLILWPKKE